MNTLNGRRLVSFVGMTILLGAVAFMAYGASIDCTGQRICVGTGSDDSITLNNDQTGSGTGTSQVTTRTIKGLGGDDNIVIQNAGAASQSGVSSNQAEEGLQEIFGGAGDDRIQLLTDATSSSGGSSGNTNNVAIFGEDGDDFIEIGSSGTNVGSSNSSAGSNTVNAGRGDDTVIVRASTDQSGGINQESQNRDVIMDGEGKDTILIEERTTSTRGGSVQNNGQASGTKIQLSADNEGDTVRGSKDANETIIMHRRSGRDVISCGEQMDDTNQSGGSNTAQQSNGTIILNGNRKATDPFGNNLFRAAREGGTAQTNCDTILP